MADRHLQEWTRTTICPALDGLELVQAQFATHTFPLHAHAEFVIGTVVRGAKRSRVGFKDMEIRPGMLTLFNPYEEHTSAGITGDWMFTGFYPSWDLISHWFGDLGGDPNQIRFSHPICGDASGAARIQALHRVLAGAASPLEAENELLETLVYFLARHGTLLANGREAAEPGICRARDRLDGDLSGQIGLAELAAIAGLPTVKLLRGFRRAFGCTPHVYSTARRLAAAKRALADGDTISDVAARFGFCDQSHFTRVFHRWTGTSPGKFAAAAAA
jgi:AraC-like DNA-binding protein